MARGSDIFRYKIVNCVRCGKIFQSYWDNQLCPECRAEVAAKEEAVIDYVMHHRNATIVEVAESCDVTVAFIRRMIERGRFVIEDNQMTYPCHGCGVEISVGNYCPECLSKMKRQISVVKEKIVKNMKAQGKLNRNDTSSRRKKAVEVKQIRKADAVINDLANKARGMFSFDFSNRGRKKK